MKSKSTFSSIKVQGNPEPKTRCVNCNIVINKRNVIKHCKKVHAGTSLSNIYFDDSGLNPKIQTYFINYKEYIKSDYWKSKANRMRKLAGYRCQVCNTNDEILDVHHRTYERLGKERDSDLIVLCRSCHTLFETKSKNRPSR